MSTNDDYDAVDTCGRDEREMYEERERDAASKALAQFEPYDPKALIAAGFKQVSRKAGHVARLPPGLTGIEALRDEDFRAYVHIMERVERECADTYRRMYARGDNLLTLSPEEMAAFRAAGGEVS